MSFVIKEITLEQFSSVCRTCLSTDNLQPLLGTKFIKMIKDITELETDIEELLPPNICKRCIRKLEDLNSFINLSRHTYRLLKSALEENNSHIEFVRIDDPRSEVMFIPDIKCESPSSVIIEEDSLPSNDADLVHSIEEKLVPSNLEDIAPCNDKDLAPLCDEDLAPSCDEDLAPSNDEDLAPSYDEDLEPFNDDDFLYSSDTELKEPASFRGDKRRMNSLSTHCKVCDTTFKSKRRYTFHLKQNPTCKSHHMKNIAGLRTYKCEICQKGFRYSANMKRHIDNVHRGLRPFICEICGKEFATLYTTEMHKRCHTNERPHLCYFCGKTFISSTTMKMHEIRHRIRNGDKTLKEEKKYNIKKYKYNFTCSFCNKNFSSKHLWQHHISLMHFNVKPFECDICGQGFTRKGYLQAHINLHTGEKPWTCKKCGLKFRSPSTYYSHMRRHKMENYHKCKVCGKLFEHVDDLKTHMQTPHTIEKPFKCIHCDRNFTTKRNLKRHTLRIHSDENYAINNSNNKNKEVIG